MTPHPSQADLHVLQLIPHLSHWADMTHVTSHTPSHTPSHISQLTLCSACTLHVLHQAPTLWDRINLTLSKAGLFHSLSCDQSLEQLQITPSRISSFRSIFKINCKQKQPYIVHAEHFVITHYKSVHYCNIPAWKGTQMALPEKQDWVLLSASHKTCQDLN